MTRTGYAAPALEKGLDILETLARQSDPLSLTRLAAELQRSKSEIFRMVMVLLDRGYVARDPEHDTLSLTNRLFTLGLRTPRARDLVSAAMPPMRTLAEATGFSLHLVVVHQGQTAVVGASWGDREVSFRLPLGFHRPALDATSGRVIIAFQSETLQQSMIAEALPLLPGPVDKAALRRDLTRIRRDGFDYHESRDFVGLVDLCCPVLDHDAHAVASILMTSLRRRRDDEDNLMSHLPALRDTCRAISHGAELV
jgi:DNA-binding IclR family transcriptional regulator